MMNRKMGVENPSTATIVCQGETFTFKLDQALADNGGIFLIIEAIGCHHVFFRIPVKKRPHQK